MSGAFTPQVRAVVNERDGCCVGCGRRDGLTIQHRRARGMGGSKDLATRSAANGLVLCGSGVHGCHGWAEANPASAAFLGWRVPQHSNPATTPVWREHSPYGPHWALLDDEGGWTRPADPPSPVIAGEAIRLMLARRAAA